MLGFQGVAFVAFSAFDKFSPLSNEERPEGIKYSYIGLKRGYRGQDGAQVLKSDVDLTDEFIRAVAACRIGARIKYWRKALEALQSDPMFEETGLQRMVDYNVDGWEEAVKTYFSLLSSGHRIVLFTITRLVEVVEERTLLLVDEPEGHLHPPLLSTFVRVLSDLLTARNGVAVIATHSPVVLQEVPRTCVWVVNRTERSARADRPDLETFGENVGVLTREVFGLEVMATGYNALIGSAVERCEGEYERVLTAFSGALGGEGRAIARGLCARYRRN